MLNESGFMVFQVGAILHSLCHKNRKYIYEREREIISWEKYTWWTLKRCLFLLIVWWVRTLWLQVSETQFGLISKKGGFFYKHRGFWEHNVELKSRNADATLLHSEQQFVYESSLTANKPLVAKWHKTACASGFQRRRDGLPLLCSGGILSSETREANFHLI